MIQFPNGLFCLVSTLEYIYGQYADDDGLLYLIYSEEDFYGWIRIKPKTKSWNLILFCKIKIKILFNK